MATVSLVTNIRILTFIILCNLIAPIYMGLLDNIFSNGQNSGSINGLGRGLTSYPNNLLNHGNRPAYDLGSLTGLQNGNNNNQHQVLAEGQKLLERLQELNRLKDEKKKQAEQNNDNSNQGVDGGNEDNNSNNENHEDLSTMKPTTKKPHIVKNEIMVLKPLTKKTFMFQTKPVVPDDVANNLNETVYYIDLK